jgi:uncharacterized membrane protein
MGYIYIIITILFTAYGQLILKWRMNALGTLPAPLLEKLWFLIKITFDPYIFSSYLAAFVAGLAWMAALAKFDLSFAYPFMSLSFVVVLIFSYLLLNEPLTISKVLGMVLIAIGVVIASR